VKPVDPVFRLGYSHEARAIVVVVFTNTLNVLVVLKLAELDAVQLGALDAWLSSICTLVFYILSKTDHLRHTPPAVIEHADESQT